ncbi:MAG: AAA family ATPase [Gammaproteobacteria bacterium]|nr:AAA family ATPase [Gammaproteobacteria bacterium]
MIYRLEIENFYCIRERQVLDLTVPRTTPDNPERFAAICRGSDLRVPKVVAIYGANGSGKSTVLKALALLAWFTRDSSQNKEPRLPCEHFNDKESRKRPLRLAIELGGLMELTRSAREEAAVGNDDSFGVYRYELELATKDGAVISVNREALRRKPAGHGKWSRVFEHRVGEKILDSKVFSLTGYTQIANKIRDNASAISTLALFGHEPSQILVKKIETIFSNILIDRAEMSDDAIIQYLATDRNMVKELNKELRRIDVGLHEMKILPAQNGPMALFAHEGLLVEMPWFLESHGTRAFIRRVPSLLAALSQGGIAIMDELDLAFHPLVLPEIVRWFYDPERNADDAQIWMSCQSVSLMEELMKEEIVLCEKDRQGRSQVYSLMDMKAVRRSDNLYKKYLSGVYGGIPHIG